MWVIRYCIALPIFLLFGVVLIIIIALSVLLGRISDLLLKIANLLSKFLSALANWGTYYCPWHVKKRQKEEKARNEATSNHPREDYYTDEE